MIEDSRREFPVALLKPSISLDRVENCWAASLTADVSRSVSWVVREETTPETAPMIAPMEVSSLLILLRDPSTDVEASFILSVSSLVFAPNRTSASFSLATRASVELCCVLHQRCKKP